MQAQRPFLLVPTAVLLLLVVTTQMADTHAQTAKQNGFSYATWWPDQYSTPEADLALSNLATTGADWISLIVTDYQDTITSTAIYTTTATPTDADLIHVITQAHSLGLKVMLKPHVDLANDPAHWRGQIGETFTDAQWTAWFASYQAFINRYAQLADAYAVDQFCVGTELSATESRADEWRATIGGVRSRYSGPLTYAANHGSESSLSWWDAVDFIGIDAYYPLTGKNDPTVAELKAAWQPISATLASLAASSHKTILFTEIGYRSQDGANQHPWDWQVGGTVDLQEQADAYQAVFETIYNQPWFAGMYWWSWGVDPFEGGECDDGYTPHDKPAEDILRAWYGASPRPRLQPPEPDYGRTLDVYGDALGSGWEDSSWDSTRIMNAIDQVYSGTQAVSITFQSWGGLSLYHAPASVAPYHWLEFYVRGTLPDQRLGVFLHDENGHELLYRPVNDCRYIEDGSITPGAWKRIRIPLAHLNPLGRSMSRVTIQNASSGPSALWVDEIRFVGAVWRVYLPLVLRDQ